MASGCRSPDQKCSWSLSYSLGSLSHHPSNMGRPGMPPHPGPVTAGGLAWEGMCLQCPQAPRTLWMVAALQGACPVLSSLVPAAARMSPPQLSKQDVASHSRNCPLGHPPAHSLVPLKPQDWGPTGYLSWLEATSTYQGLKKGWLDEGRKEGQTDGETPTDPGRTQFWSSPLQ